MTLAEKIIQALYEEGPQQEISEYAHAYLEHQLDAMTPRELLERISDALGELDNGTR